MKNNSPKHLLERIVLDKQMVDEIEMEMLIRRHIERYALVRQYAFGNVLDVACGVGYGSYLVAKNPDVNFIQGVDADKESVELANENFASDKIKFCCDKIENITGDFDVLLSLETIEHLPEPKILADLANRCNVKEVIVSFPHKKTTHYNPYHLWDIEEADIKFLFKNYECINKIFNGDSTFMHLIMRTKSVNVPKSYLGSLVK
ncbi:MAG: hypothetical protein ATN36_01300 [Epulopiscium sp. Nele67-Bin005]|nr:MAG: hypothetical protein ATN36_01300 [Epulopiscium sp. Nele67-Bin005]